MIDIIIAIAACVVGVTDADVAGLRRTSPTYGLRAQPFTDDLARSHLVHACAATAFEPTVEDNDLLAISHHESRHDPSVSTYEGSGWWWSDYGAGPGRQAANLWSCGAMTPWPHPWRCEPWELEMGGSYLAGARHLAVWTAQEHGNRLRALGGYSGWANDHQAGNAGLKAWQVFARRAAWIKSERRKVP